MRDMYFGKSFDEIFEKSFSKFANSLEDHEFRHYNRSLGMYIYSKEHLKKEMRSRRMLPYDTCCGLAEQWEKYNQRQEYQISDGALDIIKSLKLTADKDGNIKLGSRAVEALIEMGAMPRPSPRGLGYEGGFTDKF